MDSAQPFAEMLKVGRERQTDRDRETERERERERNGREQRR